MADFNLQLAQYIETWVSGVTGYIYSHPPVKSPNAQIFCIQNSGSFENPKNNWKWEKTKTIMVTGTEQSCIEKCQEIWRVLVPKIPEKQGFILADFVVYKVYTDQEPDIFYIDNIVAFANMRLKFYLAES